MRSKKVIERKLNEKEDFLNKDPDLEHWATHEYQYQKGYIQALYWVLNKTV